MQNDEKRLIEEAKAAQSIDPRGRTDLRAVPLVTIDPPDARDHDDAVWAGSDDDAGNSGGHIVLVAIADVAHYVTAGSALDAEARKRGNSTYFPDRVVPMLPDRLSGDLCSLHEGVERACVAVANANSKQTRSDRFRTTNKFKRRDKQQARFAKATDKSKVKCYNCNKYGHYSK